ncbi:thermonuclease family protein [Sphingomonas solaris]|uniref:Thermonuclease family protein n=1 Tax=Alterirhizorhabdus solaris TaxID=2529389 RepID=A0A558QRR8_9SPHN|nr:thermonuclease family protein [Sphingomonas solaris]TVV69836.1 thermonuclease family protein [Sphingomonas solaris]
MILALLAAAAFTCANPVAGDGDGLRCGSRKVRIAGIDAPELHGCRGRPGRRCVAGDGQGAKRKMAALVAGQRLRCTPVSRSYDRVVAQCRLPDGRDLSCAAIGAGIARRWASYDRSGRLRACG